MRTDLFILLKLHNELGRLCYNGLNNTVIIGRYASDAIINYPFVLI